MEQLPQDLTAWLCDGTSIKFCEFEAGACALVGDPQQEVLDRVLSVIRAHQPAGLVLTGSDVDALHTAAAILLDALRVAGGWTGWLTKLCCNQGQWWQVGMPMEISVGPIQPVPAH